MNFLFTTEIVLSYRVIIKRLGNPYCNRWQIGNLNISCISTTIGKSYLIYEKQFYYAIQSQSATNEVWIL